MPIQTPNRLRHKLLSEGGWVAASQIGSAVGQLVGIRLLTEVIDANVFGLTALLLGISTLLVTVLCAPIFKALARFYVDQDSETNLVLLRRCVCRILTWGTLVSCLLLLAGGAIYAVLYHRPLWDWLLLSLILIADVVRTMETSFMSAARRQRPAAVWTILDSVTRPFLALAAVRVLGPSTTSILLGYSIASLLALAICASVIRREGAESKGAIPIEEYANLRRDITRYALPLVPSAVVSWVSSLSDRYVIGALLGVHDAGLYAAAYGFVSRPFLMVSTIIMTTLRPVYFSSVANRDLSLQRITMKTWFLSTFGICLAGYLAVLFLGKYVCLVALSESYRSSSQFIHWIAMGYCFVSISYIFNTVSLAYMRTWSVFLSELSGACASVLVGVPLTWKFGLQGAAASVPLYFLVQLGVAWYLARMAVRAPKAIAVVKEG